MVALIIDNRENIKELVLDKIPSSIYENLVVGDYIFKIDDVPIIVIERKTIADYAASITDGRNREQKKRLLSQFPKTNIIYLVEGDITKHNSSFKYNKVDNYTVISSVLNTLLRDQIPVFHTSNVMETIFLLECIHKKLTKQGTSFMNTTSTHETDLINTVKQKKIDNMTPNIAFKMILNCIPNISNKVSQRISCKHENVYSFISKLSEYKSDSEKITYIQNIKQNDTDRKISITAAKNIVHYLGCSVVKED